MEPCLRSFHSGRNMQQHERARGGHKYVGLYDDNGSLRHVDVHTLVLSAFVSPRPDGMECRHLNGDPTDNNLENLTWGTRSENQNYRATHGTSNRGEQCAHSKLTESDVLKIREQVKTGAGIRSTARSFGVNDKTIRNIRDGNIWGWLGSTA